MVTARPTGWQSWLNYAAIMMILSVVADGWSGKPSPFIHQLLLLPFAACLAWQLFELLRVSAPCDEAPYNHTLGAVFLLCFLGGTLLLIAVAAWHFHQFGYHLPVWHAVGLLLLLAGLWFNYLRSPDAVSLLIAVLGSFALLLLLAVIDFPLNYLRSDMLPVIVWADGRLLDNLNPYGTMHVGGRVYDFPYLPGMLVAFFPAVLFRVDPRWVNGIALISAAIWVFAAAQRSSRWMVALTLGTFLLCPFLEYRHDLYLEPHWLVLAAAVLCSQAGRQRWSAFCWGASCAIYQLSWIMVPFALLYAFRRRGWREAIRFAGYCTIGALVIAGPFLRYAMHQVAHNTVGQWSRLPHALADPINVSFWLTYVVRPDQLLWLQAAVLTVLFLYCTATRRCATLADTLRWMCCALAVFIPMNVIVDGYFYLTLAWTLLLFLCARNGWWRSPADSSFSRGPELRRPAPGLPVLQTGANAP